MSDPLHYYQRKYEGIADVLLTQVTLGVAFLPNDPSEPPEVGFTGIWDTGATNTVITPRVVGQLGLESVGWVKTRHVHGEQLAKVYWVSIGFPGSFRISNLQVTEGDLQGFDVLVGMDVISLGDMAICNHDGHTKVLFQLPAHGLNSLVSEHNRLSGAHHIGTMVTTRLHKPNYPHVGRNKPCPCGSGKKFKFCHGK